MKPSLKTLIENYQPTAQATEVIRQTRLGLLAGISGAGKDTIKKELLEEDKLFHDIVSHTTRAPRLNNNRAEVNGKDYHFIDNEKARDMLEKQQFIEAKFVHGTVYGTSLGELKIAQAQNRIAITDIDVQGVAEYKSISPASIAVFILPPNYSTWLKRLKSRYQSSEEFKSEWQKRKDSSTFELKHALSVPYYHFIINDDLERAARVTKEIINREDVFHRKDDEARLLAHDLLDEIASAK